MHICRISAILLVKVRHDDLWWRFVGVFVITPFGRCERLVHGIFVRGGSGFNPYSCLLIRLSQPSVGCFCCSLFLLFL